MGAPMIFADVLDAAEQLDTELQAELVAILSRRLAELGRERVARSVDEARREFATGGCRTASAAELVQAASRLGMSLPDYAIHLLSSAHPSPDSIRSGADLVAFWQAEGLVGSRPDIADSQAQARELRELAHRRRA